MSHRSLIVLPDDSSKPILDAIAGAQKSLRVKMFVFSDAALIQAVIDAHKRGVKTQVMLNPARRSGEAENEASRKQLEHAGVEVKDSNPAFDLTHEKSMVVDGETAMIMSLNWDPKNFTETRDYAVVTSHRHEVDEVAAGFDADWHRKKFDPGEERPSDLVQPQRPQPRRAVHRRGEGHAVPAERALPGRGDHRAPGAGHAPRREAARAGAAGAHPQEGQADRGRRGAAHPPRRRRQGAQAQGPQAARQADGGRRQALHHRLDQPRPRQLRQPARARDRGGRREGDEAAASRREPRLGAFPAARPLRRGTARRPEGGSGPRPRRSSRSTPPRRRRSRRVGGAQWETRSARPYAALPDEATRRR